MDFQKGIDVNFRGTVTEEQTPSRTSLSGEMSTDLQPTSLLDEITYWTSRMGAFGITQIMSSLDGQNTSVRQPKSTPTSFTDDELYAEEERVSGFL